MDETRIDRDVRNLELSCGFSVGPVDDLRSDPTIQGYWRNGAEVSNLPAYIEQRVRSWMKAVEETSPGEGLDIDLFRLTVANKATVGFFDVVLRVTIATEAPAFVRGRYASTIWFGNEAEFREEVQSAIVAALASLHEHLAQRCSERSASHGRLRETDAMADTASPALVMTIALRDGTFRGLGLA